MYYDTSALYGQHMSREEQEAFTAFYRQIFTELPIRTLHDCSVGAGGSTIPFARLGYRVSGSDLSENLLDRARLNFREAGFEVKLDLRDFRELAGLLTERVDCIVSTGNSLPHVNLEGFRCFAASAAACLNPRGYLFFDIRNWDVMARERAPINAIDPKIMTADDYRSVFLLLNWHDDGSVTFTFATNTDHKGRHIGLETLSAPVYYPLLRADIEAVLAGQGYTVLRYIDMDDVWCGSTGTIREKTGDFEQDFEQIQWYGVLARRNV